jgi:hypothetical protein
MGKAELASDQDDELIKLSPAVSLSIWSAHFTRVALSTSERMGGVQRSEEVGAHFAYTTKR